MEQVKFLLKQRLQYIKEERVSLALYIKNLEDTLKLKQNDMNELNKESAQINLVLGNIEGGKY